MKRLLPLLILIFLAALALGTAYGQETGQRPVLIANAFSLFDRQEPTNYDDWTESKFGVRFEW
jgi:hypothetical protein